MSDQKYPLLTEVNLDEEIGVATWIEEERKEAERYNAELRTRAKTKEELMVLLECRVLSVEGYIAQSSFTPHSELRIGGTSPSYKTGDSSSLELAVESGTAVKHLHFKGLPPLEKGDTIRAYIFKGKEEYERVIISERVPFILRRFGPRTPTVLVEREFEENEQPFKIEKIRNGEVVATYHQ
ncbi:MAG TPA: hypothetical protein VJC21_04010 [Candidatus Nanoarchaeia archaeon]|nr:hypothetical protein [Candidatus Nanoarchaeia archaeon]